MKRLHFIVEGQTEKAFVTDVLFPHFSRYDVVCDARLVASSRDRALGRAFKGGVLAYARLRSELLRQMRNDPREDSFFTTMFDYYGLPSDFPGRAEGIGDPRESVRKIESAFLADVETAFPDWDARRHFAPNIVCHEFEMLLFADLDRLLDVYPNHGGEVAELKRQLRQFCDDPELVNTSVQTAPSMRIVAEIADYDKVVAGDLVTQAIGLPTLRQRCLHFNEWISGLEELLHV